MNTLLSLKSGECSHVEKEIQEGRFSIASKELELKRLQKELK